MGRSYKHLTEMAHLTHIYIFKQIQPAEPYRNQPNPTQMHPIRSHFKHSSISTRQPLCYCTVLQIMSVEIISGKPPFCWNLNQTFGVHTRYSCIGMLYYLGKTFTAHINKHIPTFDGTILKSHPLIQRATNTLSTGTQ